MPATGALAEFPDLLAPLRALAGSGPVELPDPARFGSRIEAGDIDQARRWLDAGLDPNFLADRIGTGLMIAAWEGNLPMMELFVSRGADVNAENRLGEHALMHAAWRGHLPAVRWLIEHGARTDAQPMRWTALHYAAFAGHAEVADYLIERGANVNARAPNGSSVLMMSVYEGRDELVRLLIEHGADRGIRNDRGDGALDWAVKYQRGDIARLIGNAAEVAVAASQPKNAIAQRSEQGEPDSIEELLRIRRILEARGMSLNLVDQRTAAMRARIARANLARERRARMPVLEITAKRGSPAEQDMRLLRR